ncbi:uncharacterized protein LOC100826023 [Brachypodium distachyon]|uniref:Uncharacterized protein n=1 Tax=Brachypodium distachyon TaxID=15368 RepID=I1HJP7_BRADI|nr:uncharacterized protein LOC100826023 [Brachypodium distachyon]KQK06391.1 hypothetical protein BRADI_2g26160v3 [Brachypodium distachyon]|eukprot:XP_010231417.1 uncharacterized protein LOC100826023 [Brachypodium distachyon]
MGNCLNAACKQQHREMRRRHVAVPEDREEEAACRSIGQMLLHQKEEDEEEEAVAETAAAGGMKVKVVLTRAELEWLMAQLKSGEQRLEDVLCQMGTARACNDKPPPHRDANAWRPRLECILECPEPNAGVDAT